jgi:sugar-specific transcriptional regulator TrmB
MDSDVSKVLQELGLTRVESQIFVSLLSKGSCRVGDVIKMTSFHRGTVYNTLMRLIDKGLVSLAQVSNCTEYAANPQGFLSIIADERQNLDRREVAVQEIRKRMRMMELATDAVESPVLLSYGKSAFKNFFLELFYRSRKNEEVYHYLGNGGTVHDRMGEGYYSFSQQKKVDLGVKCKVVLNEGVKVHPSIKFVAGNIKWVPHGYDFGAREMWKYNDSIVIVDWSKNPIQVQTINDPVEVQWHSNIISAFWKDIALKRDEYLEHNLWQRKRM